MSKNTDKAKNTDKVSVPTPTVTRKGTSFIEVIGTETVEVARHWRVRMAKGPVVDVDLAKFKGPVERGLFGARCFRTLGADTLSDKDAVGEKAVKILAERMAAWYAEPLGATRTSVDPFLAAARRMAVDMRKAKVTDARDMTLEGVRATFGKAWPTIEATIRARMEEDARLAMSIDFADDDTDEEEADASE